MRSYVLYRLKSLLRLVLCGKVFCAIILYGAIFYGTTAYVCASAAHAQSTETPESLRKALERESALLASEIESLEQQKTAAQQAHQARLEALESELADYTRQGERAWQRVTTLERELRSLEAQATSLPRSADDAPMDPVFDQARQTLRQRGISLPSELDSKAPQALVRWFFESAAQILADQADIVVVPGSFFVEDGSRREGKIAHIGEVAAVGVASEDRGPAQLEGLAGGALAPAPGSETLQLVAPAPQAAQAYIEGRAQHAPVLIFDPTDTQPFELWNDQANQPTERKWMDTFEDAGPIGYIIVALALLACLVALVRALGLTRFTLKERRVGEALLTIMHGRSEGDDLKRLAHVARGHESALSRITRQALAHCDLPLELYEDSVSATLIFEVGRIARGLSALRAVAAVAPLLGLLGTVVGMIATFDALTAGGAGDAKALSGGIAQALATTQLGLLVAVPTLLIHSGLQSWADRMQAYIEHVAVEISIHIRESQLPGHVHGDDHQHGDQARNAHSVHASQSEISLTDDVSDDPKLSPAGVKPTAAEEV